MRTTPASALAFALAAAIAGCGTDRSAATTDGGGAAAGGTDAQLTEQAPRRDGKAHRWELRAFGDGRIEVFMDSERVPDARIARTGNKVAVTDGAGEVIERLDIPANWTPAHGSGDTAAYRTMDGRELVPPPTMLGGRLEAVPPQAMAHMRAEHVPADPSKCAYVANVIAGLPLAQAGVQKHDVITAVNGSPDASPEAIRAILRASAPGTQVTFRLERGGEAREATVTLAAWEARHMVRMVDPRAARQAADAEDRATAEAAARAAADAAAARAAQEEAARAAAEEAAALAAARAAAEAAAKQPAADAAKVADLDKRMGEPAARTRGRPQPAPQPSAGGAPR